VRPTRVIAPTDAAFAVTAAGTLTQRHERLIGTAESSRTHNRARLAFCRARVPQCAGESDVVRVFSATNNRHATARIRPNRIRPNSRVRRHIVVAAKPRLALCKPELASR
jgi:hypothetical protein